jgi:hypothetical protein
MHPKRQADPKAKRPKVVDNDLDSLVEAAWEAGAHCVGGGKNHVKVYPADMSRMIPIPSTPSGNKTYRNKRQALRRAGIPVD